MVALICSPNADLMVVSFLAGPFEHMNILPEGSNFQGSSRGAGSGFSPHRHLTSHISRISIPVIRPPLGTTRERSHPENHLPHVECAACQSGQTKHGSGTRSEASPELHGWPRRDRAASKLACCKVPSHCYAFIDNAQGQHVEFLNDACQIVCASVVDFVLLISVAAGTSLLVIFIQIAGHAMLTD